MLMLASGNALFIFAHLFKRIAPGLRASMGAWGLVMFGVLLIISTIMMVQGYRAAEGPYFWGRTPAMTGINNVLMLIALYMFATSILKTELARRMRHPMMIAVKIWALAHLLVNGDLPSFILFGGMMGWAVLQMIMINRAEPEWTPPPPVPFTKEVLAVAVAIALFAGIATIHGWLGYRVFG